MSFFERISFFEKHAMTDKCYEAYRKLFKEANLIYYDWALADRKMSLWTKITTGAISQFDAVRKYDHVNAMLSALYTKIAEAPPGPKRDFEIENKLFSTCLAVKDFSQHLGQSFTLNCEAMLRLQ